MSKSCRMKDKRVQFLVSDAELAAIDAWWHKHHKRTRGEAIREMCRIAIKADGVEIQPRTDTQFVHPAPTSLQEHVYPLGK